MITAHDLANKLLSMEDLPVFAGYSSDNPLSDVTDVNDVIQITGSNDENNNSIVLRLGLEEK